MKAVISHSPDSVTASFGLLPAALWYSSHSEKSQRESLMPKEGQPAVHT